MYWTCTSAINTCTCQDQKCGFTLTLLQGFHVDHLCLSFNPVHVCFSLLLQGPGRCTAEGRLWTAVYQESVCGSASPSLFWWRSKTFPLRKESLNTNPSLWTKRNYALIQEPSLHHSVISSLPISIHARSHITASFPPLPSPMTVTF